MQIMTFEQFRAGNYEELGEELYKVYDNFMRLLYVGISQYSIYGRWFYGAYSHMAQNIYGEWYPVSQVGSHILKNMPNALCYTVRIYTLEDCASLYADEIIKNGYKPDKIDIKIIERLIIRAEHPLLNIHNNP